jgi:hypothetical protein
LALHPRFLPASPASDKAHFVNRSLLSGVPSGTLEGYYSRNANQITQGKISRAAQIKSDMSKIIPDEARFRLAVSTAHVANQSLARYYLRALQRKADGKAEPQYVPNPGSEVTLEHILPKNLDKVGSI